jgi:hypothetical protein
LGGDAVFVEGKCFFETQLGIEGARGVKVGDTESGVGDAGEGWGCGTWVVGEGWGEGDD